MGLWYFLSVVSGASALALMVSVRSLGKARRAAYSLRSHRESLGVPPAGLVALQAGAGRTRHVAQQGLPVFGVVFLAVNGWMVHRLATFDAPAVPSEMVVVPLLALVPAVVFMYADSAGGPA